MDIHNTTEDLVIAEVNAICDSLEAEKEPSGLCTCAQCRQDAVCYVLNRAQPHYVVSHRGMVRAGQTTDQQGRVDLTALVYEGIRRVNHNKRPYFTHGGPEAAVLPPGTPVFNVPTIMGRVFNGLNFSPMADIMVELLQNGSLTAMKDNNWQNPFALIANTYGTFTFWPKPVPVEKPEVRAVFEYTVRIAAPDFAERTHVFTIPLMSELDSSAISLSNIFKLPDLYLFPAGEEKDQLIINE
ncbi:MAG: late competence development ComFB family protein [Treponema sp.]|jgi:competence protein ComFB|nr:late competence development ComFB family protein [Treponema sp.]